MAQIIKTNNGFYWGDEYFEPKNGDKMKKVGDKIYNHDQLIAFEKNGKVIRVDLSSPFIEDAVIKIKSENKEEPKTKTGFWKKIFSK